jgi:hypothetical protein
MTDELLKQIGLGMAGAFGSAIVALLWKLVGAVVSLNEKMAIICERVNTHDKLFEAQDKRFDRIESVIN